MNFLRSIPADCLTSIMVGMKSEKSLKENFEVIHRGPLGKDAFWDYLMKIDTSETQRQVDEMQKKIDEKYQEEREQNKES